VEFVNHPGRFGLEKMVNSAERRRLPNGTHELKWAKGNVAVAVHLKIISTPSAAAPAATEAGTSSQGSALRGATLPAIVAGESSSTHAPAGSPVASHTTAGTAK
jgi:type VI secretion system protein ImpL